MMDFPDPVSPVMAVNPGWIDQVKSSTSARFRIRNEIN
jgi:hypothetical protein